MPARADELWKEDYLKALKICKETGIPLSKVLTGLSASRSEARRTLPAIQEPAPVPQYERGDLP